MGPQKRLLKLYWVLFAQFSKSVNSQSLGRKVEHITGNKLNIGRNFYYLIFVFFSGKKHWRKYFQQVTLLCSSKHEVFCLKISRTFSCSLSLNLELVSLLLYPDKNLCVSNRRKHIIKSLFNNSEKCVVPNDLLHRGKTVKKVVLGDPISQVLMHISSRGKHVPCLLSHAS